MGTTGLLCLRITHRGEHERDDSPRTTTLKSFNTRKNLRKSMTSKGRKPGRHSMSGKQFNIPMDMGDLETGLERNSEHDMGGTKQYSMHQEMQNASMGKPPSPQRSPQPARERGNRPLRRRASDAHRPRPAAARAGETGGAGRAAGTVCCGAAGWFGGPETAALGMSWRLRPQR